MTKVKIPVSTMGTSLTEEELKSIVGGCVKVTKTCTCTLSYLEPEETKVTSAKADDEDQCRIKCEAQCQLDEECVQYFYEYKEEILTT